MAATKNGGVFKEKKSIKIPKMVVFIKRKIPKNTKNGGFYKEKKYLKPKC